MVFLPIPSLMLVTLMVFFPIINQLRQIIKRQGYSHTHARILYLFDLLPSKNHVIGLDNLFMSGKLCVGAYKGKNQVQIHGMVRKSGCGIPSCVLQEFQIKFEVLSKLQFWKMILLA